jgi:glycosyltransferase involved in cell wall biosynthesis
MTHDMKIAILNVQVPFIRGGAEIQAELLQDELIKRGYEADIIKLPFKWYPPETIMDCIMISRMVDIREVNGQKIDLVIALKFPAYYVKHENKVLWICHQHRQAYELWGTEYGDLQNMKFGEKVREMIQDCDNKFIPEAKIVFTNARTTSDRLLRFNKINASPLYPPPKDFEKFRAGEFGDFIFYPSRIDAIKRQILLVSALKYCKTPVRVVLAGKGEKFVIDKLNSIAIRDNTKDKIEMKGFISEDEKIDLYSKSLGVYFGPYQEDYGYVTLEAFFSRKPVITHPDSGGPLEFVDSENGFVVEPTPQSIAKAMDYLYTNREYAKKLGENGFELMNKLEINWDHVIERLVV